MCDVPSALQLLPARGCALEMPKNGLDRCVGRPLPVESGHRGPSLRERRTAGAAAPMKHVKKSVLLWYSPAEMYRLVTDIPAYPQFLPWCERAEVLAQDGQDTTARLSLSYAGVKQAFTTRNSNVADESVRMALVDGPFSQLEGIWLFKPIGDGKAAACRIEFELSYAFSNRALQAVVSPVFDRIANTFVESFVKRAAQVYGER